MGIHQALGDSVTVAIATSGAFTHNEKLAAELKKPKAEQDPAIINEPPDAYAAQKAEELTKATALFGITDVRILPGPQPFIMDENPDIVQQMTQIIQETKPHVLVTQSPYFESAFDRRLRSGYVWDDHTQTAFAIQRAQYYAGSPRLGADHPPHRIAATLYPGVYFNMNDWDFAVDISDWIDQRVAAENHFKSQGHWEAWSEKRMEISLGNHGWFSGTRYAEGFVRDKRELLSKIEISPYTLQAADESAEKHMERLVGSPKPAE
jgi:LmbE family N-acetylglucosaminyl deacetylase